MRFTASGRRTGLEDLVIECDCGARRSLEGIIRTDALADLGVRCGGRQPWEIAGSDCHLFPLVKQRGATNIHFADVASSIDIPPYSNATANQDMILRITNTPEFGVYRNSLDDSLLVMLAPLVADRFGYTVDDVSAIMRSEATGTAAPGASTVPDYADEEELKREEYTVFLQPRPATDPFDNFQKRDVSLLEAVSANSSNETWNEMVRLAAGLFGRLVLITRLREVRVARQFSRLTEPPLTVEVMREQANGANVRVNEAARWVPVAAPELDWLPAAQVYGEGIFFTLNEDSVQRWLRQTPDVVTRASVLRDRQAADGGPRISSEATPEFLLLHTLSHVIIRQLSFECGYGSSSLRERLYSGTAADGTRMSGVLIYTSAGDSEGTMGGLVRQGKPVQFLTTVCQALRNAMWCSSDPLCIESPGQGLGALNLAACHACSLLPETSCTEMNRLLDRASLVGTSQNPAAGYFSRLIDIMTL